MTVRIWGNPRTISNPDSLFSIHNWKWVNLSKMAGFNISLSLNERQSSSDKMHNKSLRLVLFFPFRCCFAGSLPFSLNHSETNETMPLHFRNVFHFFSEKKSLSNTFLAECVRSGAASCNKGGNFGAKLTHLCSFWLDVSFFSHVKKHRSRFWLDVSFFSRVKTIVRSSDWLELICVRKFTT